MFHFLFITKTFSNESSFIRNAELWFDFKIDIINFILIPKRNLRHENKRFILQFSWLVFSDTYSNTKPRSVTAFTLPIWYGPYPIIFSGEIWQWFRWCKTKWTEAGVHSVNFTQRLFLMIIGQRFRHPAVGSQPMTINPFPTEEIPKIRLDTNLPSINDDPSDELGEVDEILNGDNEGIVRNRTF